MFGGASEKKDAAADSFGFDFGMNAPQSQPAQEVQPPAEPIAEETKTATENPMDGFDLNMDAPEQQAPVFSEAVPNVVPNTVHEAIPEATAETVSATTSEAKPEQANFLSTSLDLDLIPSLVEPEKSETSLAEPLAETDDKGVPAVVCANREDLCAMWRKNMTAWREQTQKYQELCAACEATSQSNAALRASVQEAQKRLDAMQEEVQEKLTRIAVMQAQLSNHLVNNGLLRPVRAVIAQPDMDNLFTAPPPPAEEPKPEEVLLPPQPECVIPDAPAKWKSPILKMKKVPAFQRSPRARSFVGAAQEKEAIGDSSDEEAVFAPIPTGSRWYGGVGGQKKLNQEELLLLEKKKVFYGDREVESYLCRVCNKHETSSWGFACGCPSG